jgi:ABC-2 type transport system permease protein
MCNRVIVISEGKKVLDGSTHDLIQKANHQEQVIISIPRDEKDRFEIALATSLRQADVGPNSHSTYYVESSISTNEVIQKVNQANLKLSEIYLNRPNIDQAITKRELRSYCFSPLASIFLVIFLMSMAGFTFILGNFYESNNASLELFFNFHPWIYLFLVPAIGMRLWSEELRGGTFEILSTLPFTISDLIVGKFLAAWLFIAAALFFTFPMIVTVFYLGSPDIGPMITGYLGSWLMAGTFLAITAFTSSLSKNQVISFVIAILLSLIFVLLGFGVFQSRLEFLPAMVSEFLANLGFIPHFQVMVRGIIDTRDLFYFLATIGLFLTLNGLMLKRKYEA